MYSVVLMAAMTASVEAPNFGGSFWTKHCFYETCYPARYGWTCGPGQGGYYPTGYSCCGCTGYNNWNSCHGCWSSCNGCWSSCNGCWSSCHGCHGLGYQWTSCSGCCGMSLYGCYGTIPYAMGAGYAGCVGTGNFGMYGVSSVPINPYPIDPLGLSYSPLYNTPIAPMLGSPSPVNPILDVTPGSGNPGTVTPVIPQPKSSTTPKLMTQTKATVHPFAGSIAMKVPANAKVFVDGNPMSISSATERLFHSPVLELGETYFYMVKVETIQDGKVVHDEKKVRVRAGDITNVSFEHLMNRGERDRTSVADAKR